MRLSTVIALVVLIIIAVVLSNRRRPRLIVDRDLAVLKKLKEAGSNLSKPHPVEFFLYFPSEQAAAQAEKQIRAEGFDVSVELGADKQNWLCLVRKEMVPVHQEILRIRARFEELATSLNGQYDGWGTPIVR